MTLKKLRELKISNNDIRDFPREVTKLDELKVFFFNNELIKDFTGKEADTVEFLKNYMTANDILIDYKAMAN